MIKHHHHSIYYYTVLIEELICFKLVHVYRVLNWIVIFMYHQFIQEKFPFSKTKSLCRKPWQCGAQKLCLKIRISSPEFKLTCTAAQSLLMIVHSHLEVVLLLCVLVHRHCYWAENKPDSVFLLWRVKMSAVQPIFGVFGEQIQCPNDSKGTAEVQMVEYRELSGFFQRTLLFFNHSPVSWGYRL